MGSGEVPSTQNRLDRLDRLETKGRQAKFIFRYLTFDKYFKCLEQFQRLLTEVMMLPGCWHVPLSCLLCRFTYSRHRRIYQFYEDGFLFLI